MSERRRVQDKARVGETKRDRGKTQWTTFPLDELQQKKGGNDREVPHERLKKVPGRTAKNRGGDSKKMDEQERGFQQKRKVRSYLV